MEVPDQPPTHRLISMRAEEEIQRSILVLTMGSFTTGAPEEEIQREKGGSPYLSN